MRIALVCGEYDPEHDGVSDYTRRLAAELQASDAEAVIVTSRQRAAALSGVRGAAGAWTFVGAAQTARLLLGLRVDLVHVQFAPSAYEFRPGIGLLPLMLCHGPPVVVTLHEYGWWKWQPRLLPGAVAQAAWPRLERAGWWDRETLMLAPRSARVVVTNDVHLRQVAGRLPASGPRVARIPIGVNLLPAQAPGADRDADPAKVREAVRAELGARADAPVVAHFGFAHPNKGLEDVIEAVGRLRRVRTDLRLLVVGGSESLALRGHQAVAYRRRLQQLISDRGLGRSVTFTGYQPAAEVSRLLAAADVAVFAFTHGTTAKSGSLLTALAHGLPAVATVADPPDPLLRDGRTTLLVPRHDPAALSAAIDLVLSDRRLADRLARSGKALVERHSWSSITAAHRRLYAQVLHESRR